MASQWNELLSSSTAGMRVAICRPENSERLFLDVRKTYVWEDEERLTDEGLRVRVKDLPGLAKLLGQILRGEQMTGSVNGLSLARRGAFLRLQRTGRQGETLKIHSAQTAFLRTVVTDFVPQVETLINLKEESELEDVERADKAWAEYSNC